MAEYTLSKPVAAIHGSIDKKSGIINRQKRYRDERGRVIIEGKQEAYAMRNPRDFKKNPRQGTELANFNHWQEACRRASQILQAGQPGGPTALQLDIRKIEQVPDYYSIEEAHALYLAFQKRFLAQIPNTRGKRPDSAAPIDPKTGRGKRYIQLPAFIRAMIFQQLKLRSDSD